MEIILLQDVDKLGKKGEVANVSEGYARNFLLPRKLAERATAGRIAAGPQDHGREGGPRRAARPSGPTRPGTCCPRPCSPSRLPVGSATGCSARSPTRTSPTPSTRRARSASTSATWTWKSPSRRWARYMVKVHVHASVEPAEVKVIVAPEEHKA